jgi:arylsulfatase
MSSRPNLILITASHVRWDALACMGNPDVATPNLDILAEHGLIFDQAIAASPVGASARASLHTGRFPSVHGVHGDEDTPSAPCPTVAQHLIKAGYDTALVGQVGFCAQGGDMGFENIHRAEYPREELMEVDDGYHAWLSSEGQQDQTSYWDRARREQAPRTYWNSFGALASNLPETHYSTTWIGDRAVRGLRGLQEPFFLCMSFLKPDHPFDPPTPWNRMYDPKTLTLPSAPNLSLPSEWADFGDHFDHGKLTESRFRRILAHYYGGISLLDKQVGRLLATLTALGITNNILIFSADCGAMMGQRGLVIGQPHPHEAQLRIPLIIGGMTGQRRGSRESALVEQTDLFPTLLQLAGIPSPKGLPGKSMAPLLWKKGVPWRKTAYAEGRDGIRVARTTRHKLVSADGETPATLHDLKRDPNEETNCFGEASLATVQTSLEQQLKRRQR